MRYDNSSLKPLAQVSLKKASVLFYSKFIYFILFIYFCDSWNQTLRAQFRGQDKVSTKLKIVLLGFPLGTVHLIFDIRGWGGGGWDFLEKQFLVLILTKKNKRSAF